MFMEYAWLIPLIPAICFVLAGLIGKKTPQGGGYIAILGAAAACVISALVSYDYLTSSLYGTGAAYTMSMKWITIAGFDINFGIYIDGLSCIMMLFASFISTMIFVYSLGYMGDQGDKKRRYYAEVSLFLTGMMGLVTAGNFLEMFIFWEIMGLCSYLLIGFWSFDHPEAKQKSSAAKKAFLVTRMGDVCLMGGLFILLYLFHSLDYVKIFDPLAIKSVDQTLLTLASLLIFAGVIGKSAQFPLHDWLPDAMAGPTTVSALIHAATMVKAGVYLTARSFPLFVYNTASGDVVCLFVAIIGGVTAIFAASQALNNMNIKKVLAYSTLSQLGYMILALGAGAYMMWMGYNGGYDATTSKTLLTLGAAGYTAGIFHMVNHAFFKALLFLCSGSVIHATGTEDMRLMGGLRKKMPITAYTMLLGSLSIAGIPFLSGFWSKDMVLEAALGPFNNNLGFGSWFCVLFALAVITAFMTAFYMFRMWFMTFTGAPAEHQHCHGESPKSMTVPLCILAIFAVLSGLLIIFGLGNVTYDSLLSYGFTSIHMHTGMDFFEEILTNPWTYVSIVLAVLGILLGWLMYTKKSINPGKFNKNGESWLYKLLQNRYYFPQLYNFISWTLGFGIARGVDYFDRNVIDGTVNGMSNAVIGSADVVSKAETGYVRDYATIIVLGIIALVAVLAIAFCVLGGM